MRTLSKRAGTLVLVALFLGLVPMALRAQDTGQDPQATVDAVIERYETAQEAYYDKYRAGTREEREKLVRPDVDSVLLELVGLAKRYPSGEAAAKAWMMVAQLAPQGSDAELLGLAVEVLARDHAASPLTARLGSVIYQAGRSIGAERTLGYLRQVVKQVPQGATQGGALLALAQALSGEGPAAGSPEEQELNATLARLQADYVEQTDSTGRSFATLAEGMAFERKHLKVGLPVPEIEAADLNGVTFKLSDYRGKVVLLDFWGDW